MANTLIKVILIIGLFNLALPYILQTPHPVKEFSEQENKIFNCVVDKYDIRSGGVWRNNGKPYVIWKGKKVFLNTKDC